MTKLFLVAAAAGSLLSGVCNAASAADIQKSTVDGGCGALGLTEGALKSCNEQMARAKSENERMEVRERFQKDMSTGGDPAATLRTTGDPASGILPDQKKHAPGSGAQGAADKKGTPERTP